MMSMTIRNCAILAILSALLWAPAAPAAPPPGAALPGAEDNDVEQLRAKVREQVRGMAIRRTAQMLGLDAAASGRLGTVVVRYDDQIYALRRENMKARRELVQLVKAGQPADARINQLVDQLTAGRVRIVHLAEERAKEVRRLLTPLQFGKLIAMGPLVRRQVRMEVMRALGGPGLRGPGMGWRGGPGGWGWQPGGGPGPRGMGPGMPPGGGPGPQGMGPGAPGGGRMAAPLPPPGADAPMALTDDVASAEFAGDDDIF